MKNHNHNSATTARRESAACLFPPQGPDIGPDPEALDRLVAKPEADALASNTRKAYRAAVAHQHRGHPDPNPAHDHRVRDLLSGLSRQAAEQGNTPRQAAPPRWEHILRIIKTAYRPRYCRPGGRLETSEQAARRAEYDIAMIVVAHDTLLRCGELRTPHPTRCPIDT